MRVGYVLLLLLASAARSPATLLYGRGYGKAQKPAQEGINRSAAQEKIGHRDSNLFSASPDDASVSAMRKCSACLFFTGITAATLALSELVYFVRG